MHVCITQWKKALLYQIAEKGGEKKNTNLIWEGLEILIEDMRLSYAHRPEAPLQIEAKHTSLANKSATRFLNIQAIARFPVISANEYHEV